MHNPLGNALLIALTDTNNFTINFSTPHLGLFTKIATSGENEGEEVVGNNYTREALTTQFGTPVNGVISNNGASGGDVVFKQPGPGDWERIAGWGLFSALSGPGTLYLSSLGTTFTTTLIAAGDTPRFADSSLVWILH